MSQCATAGRCPPLCGGRGKRTVEACEPCDGVGVLEVERVERVRVPAGARDGELITLRGAGNPGSFGGRDGALRVTVKVQPLPPFKRRGKTDKALVRALERINRQLLALRKALRADEPECHDPGGGEDSSVAAGAGCV